MCYDLPTCIVCLGLLHGCKTQTLIFTRTTFLFVLRQSSSLQPSESLANGSLGAGRDLVFLLRGSSTDVMAAALQERLQTASAEFQKIQDDLTVAVDARQKLDAQLSENELVKKVRPTPVTPSIHPPMP